MWKPDSDLCSLTLSLCTLCEALDRDDCFVKKSGNYMCEKKTTWDLIANSLGYSRLSHRCINGPAVWIQRFVSALHLVSKTCYV